MGTIAKSEGTREGQLEVLADHSTEGQDGVDAGLVLWSTEAFTRTESPISFDGAAHPGR